MTPFPKVGRFHPIVLIVISHVTFTLIEISGQSATNGGDGGSMFYCQCCGPTKEPNRSDPSIGLTI